MLNGKFYTGLPPRMINRNNGTFKNRMESNLFWPDDTDTETVTESRVRRRASLSMTPSEKPIIQKRNSSQYDTPDELDTKQMLRKEFAKSSIQFFDNIVEDVEPLQQQRQKPLLRAGKQEITNKPTATKLVLPDVESNTAALKKKNVFDSKVEFYDYADEDVNNRNNMRKSKIDMNNKLEMEKNSKNSPKLQNKRQINNYIESEFQNKQNSNDYEFLDEDREIQRNSRGKSVEARNRNNNQKYRRDQTPKRILKPTVRNGIDYSDYPECRDEEDYNEASDYVNESFRHMQINGRRPALKKRVSYSEEDEDIPVRTYDRRIDDDHDLHNQKGTNKPKYRNSYLNAETKRRQQHRERERYDSPESEGRDLDQNQYAGISNMERKNNYNNNSNTNNNNRDKNNYKCEIINNATADILDNSVKSNNNYNNRVINMAQKHLRSSLCFHDGEIVASDNEAATATSTGQRRNARNAATRRVSVGLPD